ncbi:hypothetical protein Lepto7375DRAFT_7188 [Leptolyngbya sp. PCC 7375]|nr:hypothetical protein Lepto7375DRAFT_7188 [Leptolyngbya sp. PCC 7375]
MKEVSDFIQCLVISAVLWFVWDSVVNGSELLIIDDLNHIEYRNY